MKRLSRKQLVCKNYWTIAPSVVEQRSQDDGLMTSYNCIFCYMLQGYSTGLVFCDNVSCTPKNNKLWGVDGCYCQQPESIQFSFSIHCDQLNKVVWICKIMDPQDFQSKSSPRVPTFCNVMNAHTLQGLNHLIPAVQLKLSRRAKTPLDSIYNRMTCTVQFQNRARSDVEVREYHYSLPVQDLVF